MKELGSIKEIDITINNKPRFYKDTIENLYGAKYNFASQTRWLARWYKCYCYTSKK